MCLENVLIPHFQLDNIFETIVKLIDPESSKVLATEFVVEFGFKKVLKKQFDFPCGSETTTIRASRS